MTSDDGSRPFVLYTTDAYYPRYSTPLTSKVMFEYKPFFFFVCGTFWYWLRSSSTSAYGVLYRESFSFMMMAWIFKLSSVNGLVLCCITVLNHADYSLFSTVNLSKGLSK